MTAPLLPRPEPARSPRSRRGPVLMVAVLGATVIAAGAVTFAVKRGDDRPPRLVLTAAGGGAETRSGVAMDMSMPAGQITYVIDGTLPGLPDHAPVWKLVGASVDREQVAEWAGLMNIDGEVRDRSIEGTRSWEVGDERGTLSVSTSDQSTWVSMSGGLIQSSTGSPGFEGSGFGGSGFGGCAPGHGLPEDSQPPFESPTTGTPEQPIPPADPPIDPGTNVGSGSEPGVGSTVPCVVEPMLPVPAPVPPAALPSAPEAEKIARELLTAMGVLDGDWTFTVSDGGSIGVAISCGANTECTDTPTAEQWITSRSVLARRNIEGAPVVGLEWYIDVGDRGEITNVNGQLGSLERVGDYPLTTPADALHQLEASGGGGVTTMDASEPAIAIGCVPADGPCPAAPCEGECFEPEPIVVHVTDVSLAAQVWYGGDASTTQYVVPMYHFTGYTDTSDEWPVEALALGKDALSPPTTIAGKPPVGGTGRPEPVPVPEPTSDTRPDTPTVSGPHAPRSQTHRPRG